MVLIRRFVRSFAHAAVMFVAAASVCALAQPFGYSVRSDSDDRLYRINLATGVAAQLGATGFGKIEGLALSPTGELFGVHLIPSQPAQLVRCSTTTGACTAVGTTSAISGGTAGLAFNSTGQLFLATSSVIFTVNTTTGAATALSSASGPAISGLASGATSANCTSGLYALAGNADAGKFYCVNTTTGALSLLGTLVGLTPTTAIDGGIDGDRSTGFIWGITNPSDANAAAQVYSINPTTLVVSAFTAITLNGTPIGGFESLAVEPSPAVISVSPPSAPAIPTTSEYGLIALAFGLSVFAMIALRRRDSLRFAKRN